MWRELMLALDADAEFHSPASAEHMSQAEMALGQSLPAELVDLLTETNGAEISFGVSVVWGVDKMVANNLHLRAEWRPGGEMGGCMPIDHLLLFGESSNGDMFAFPITAEGVRNQIFVLDHEDDSRRCEANSLQEWFTFSSRTPKNA
jgi:hypothetical protein